MFLFLFIFFYLGMTIDELFILKIIILIGISIYLIKNKSKKYKYYVFAYLLGIFISFIYRQNFIFSNIGVVVISKDNYFILQTLTGRYYCSNYENTYEVFDLLKVNGYLKDYSFTTYESQFDFNEYLKESFVYKEIKINDIKAINYSLIRPRSFINRYISSLGKNSKIVISKLLFNSNYDHEFNFLISKNGLFYYLSISSFHLGVVFENIKKILQIKINEKKSELIVLVINFIFIFISSYRLSIIRLFLFNIFRYINNYHRKEKFDRSEIIGIVFLLLGIFFPQSLKGISFLFSFPLYMLLYYFNEPSKQIKKRHRSVYYLVLINLYFIIIQLFINGYCSLLSFIYGLLISYLIIFVFILGLIRILIPIDFILEFASIMIISSIKFFDKINLIIYTNDFNFIFVLFSFVFILCGFYLIYTGRKNKVYWSLYGVSLCILIPCLPKEIIYENSVYFINVGQGDSILIRNKSTSILIDTGGVNDIDLAKETLIPFFKKIHINKIDYLIITHDDFDHNGSSFSLSENFKIISRLDSSNYHPIYLKELSLVNLNDYRDKWKDKNDSSLVLYLNFKSYKFLFTGDISKSIEKYIINDYIDLEMDYLKVAHHGSNSSTCEELLKTFSFKEAIISVGAKNNFGHPSKEVIALLNKYNVKIRRTDIEGTIKYSIK